MNQQEFIETVKRRLLGLADCSARNFTSKIAHFSLVIIRYNLMASLKRSTTTRQSGGLFANMYSGVHELTVIEKIWDIILEVVAVVSEIMEIDEEELLEQVITNNDRLAAFQMLVLAHSERFACLIKTKTLNIVYIQCFTINSSLIF